MARLAGAKMSTLMFYYQFLISKTPATLSGKYASTCLLRIDVNWLDIAWGAMFWRNITRITA
ncbi:hypothetical protein KOY48_04085 [Candidatus Minimicrobia naudis]|uniref:Uncharacterized protein n=1 Tax=Candidatus Minimicrobia naudis TaxID=2841263 RepID=A0A8F1MB11_9BACT|nr:hypothetical protein KOY48_04085 [Candidatus Minimicrobia naudis]